MDASRYLSGAVWQYPPSLIELFSPVYSSLSSFQLSLPALLWRAGAAALSDSRVCKADLFGCCGTEPRKRPLNGEAVRKLIA